MILVSTYSFHSYRLPYTKDWPDVKLSYTSTPKRSVYNDRVSHCEQELMSAVKRRFISSCCEPT